MAILMSVAFALPVYYLCQMQGSFFVFWLAWLISLADGIGESQAALSTSCLPSCLLVCSLIMHDDRCSTYKSCSLQSGDLFVYLRSFCIWNSRGVPQHGHCQLRAADLPHSAPFCRRLRSALGRHPQILDLVSTHPLAHLLSKGTGWCKTRVCHRDGWLGQGAGFNTSMHALPCFVYLLLQVWQPFTGIIRT